MTSSALSMAKAFAVASACVALLLSGLIVAADTRAASAGSDPTASIAKKKKCKVTQTRNKKGKCVTKKCKKGYKLSTKGKTKGKCLKIKCKKGYKLSKKGKCVKNTVASGGGTSNPVIDRGDADVDGIGRSRELSLGTDPNRKDIFVQLNFSSPTVKASVPCSELDKLVDVFATAPVSNPSGVNGINLHIDAGITCPSRSYSLGGSFIFTPDAPCPDFRQVSAGLGMANDRAGLYHVAAVTDTCAQGEGGSASAPWMVIFTTGSGIAMTLMHELGHNLGLDHLSNPNRESVMNRRLSRSATGSGSEDFVDYQRYALPTLDEANLVEADGIGIPPEMWTMFVTYNCPNGDLRNVWLGDDDGAIDWNCSAANWWDPQDIQSGTVSADINNDGQLTVLPATPNEWNLISLTAGGKITQ